MRIALVTAVSFTIVLSGCAQSFLKGATIVKKDLSKESSADFNVTNCRDAKGKSTAGPEGVTYHLVDYKGHPGLFERFDGGSSVITNSWRDTDGMHYFTYVMANGWEYVIPESGNGTKRIYRGGTVRADDGTARPTKKAPQFECDLVRTR